MLKPELHMRDTWDAKAVSELIRSKCRFGETPAFLFVGKKEAELLRGHLAEAFGTESVTTLHQTEPSTIAVPFGVAADAPMPAMARSAMSHPALGATAQPSDATVNSTMPMRKNLRRPWMSPIFPKIGLPMPRARKGPVMAHASALVDESRSSATVLSEALMTVVIVP